MSTPRPQLPSVPDVLNFAADRVLWDGTSRRKTYTQTYSCIAIEVALKIMLPTNERGQQQLETSVINYLRDMGMGNNTSNAFDDISDPIERQQVRYNWLKFAADAYVPPTDATST